MGRRAGSAEPRARPTGHGAGQLPGAGTGQDRLGGGLLCLRRGKYDALLHRLADEGSCCRCGWGWQHGAFVHASLAGELAQAQAGTLKATHTTALSPFDPGVGSQAASELFGFDYRIECYTPAPSASTAALRAALLHRGRLVG